MTELACKEVVFHFNKAHLADPKIPMWVIKARGTTYYVNHVNCTLPWTTKETPDNSHTKGSIKVRHVLLNIDDNNEATLSRLTLADQKRLEQQSEPLRIGWTWQRQGMVEDLLENLEIEHSRILWVSAGCSTGYYVCDIYDMDALIQLKLSVGDGFRQFASNEWQYKEYESDLREQEEDELAES